MINLSFESVPWQTSTLAGWLGFQIYIAIVCFVYYFLSSVFFSLYLRVCLAFRVFRKQFESIVAKLNAELGTEEEIDQIVVKQIVCDLVKQHVFMRK